MIGKKIFSEKIEMLQTLYGIQLSADQVNLYYNKLTADMSDDDFSKQVNTVMETEYRFPPLAAFYKGFEKTPTLTPEQSAAIRRVREKYENRGDEP